MVTDRATGTGKVEMTYSVKKDTTVLTIMNLTEYTLRCSSENPANSSGFLGQVKLESWMERDS